MELLERETPLQALEGALAEAANGSGRLLLLAGEAGVGKSVLLQHVCERASEHARAFVGACDPLSTPRPLGPLLDIAPALDRQLEGLLLRGAGREEIYRRLLAALAERPTLLIVEDVHWADEATLDLLQFLGRRLGDLPTLLVASYRHDEIGADHPLRAVLGHLATAPALQRLLLAPLSEEGVRHLAAGSDRDAAELHRRTGGNPFFVSEILASPERRLPDSVRDVVLARAARLSPAGRRTLEAASVIGFRIEPWLLAELAGDAFEAAEECLAVGLLRTVGTLLTFRHELAREAILGALSPPRRLALNQGVLARLRTTPTLTTPDGLARLAHHAEAAGDVAAVLEFAPAAARRAALLRAHREAAAQYARALRFASALPAGERAELLEARSYECYLTGDIEEAISARRASLELHRETGEAAREGSDLRWLSRLSWYGGRRGDAAAAAGDAIAILERLEPGLELAWAYSNRSQLCMLSDDVAGAVMWGERALDLAGTFGNAAVETHALNNIGTARYTRGETQGRGQLEQALRLAREHGLEEHVARALTNLASVSVKSRQLAQAEHYLAEGIGYCSDRDLGGWHAYMRGWRAVALLYRGRWDRASDEATAMLSQPHLAAVSRIQPLLVLGLLRARRGDPGVDEDLEEAEVLAREADELQRLAPVAIARAEAHWLGASSHDPLALLRRCLRQAREADIPWIGGELAYWAWKLGDPPAPRERLARPYALQLAGAWREAAAAWRELGLPYEHALALAEGEDEAALHRAHAELRRLGASAAAARVTARLEALGHRRPPSGPRRSTLANPAQLTRRQLQVLELMAEGLSNAEIAGRLHRSTKTIDHHVSAVLAKLEVQNRTEAVRKAVENGLV